MSAPEVYEFEDLEVDLRRMVVRRGGVPVPLEPKTFDVLRVLIERRDRVVTKDELLDAIWKDTFVTPNVLTRAVAQLRKALGDDAFDARYVETVSKRGYRFIAVVRVPGSPDGEPMPSSEREAATAVVVPATSTIRPFGTPRVRWAAAGVGVVAALSLTAYVALSRDRSASSPPAPGTLSLRRLDAALNTPYGVPAISPDGRSVAYASDESGDLSVVGLVPGSKGVAITSDAGRNVEAQWSPDGRWIAYRSIRRGGIWIVPSTGGAPRELVTFGGQPAWAPSGDVIAFTSNPRNSAQTSLWSVHTDGTHLTQVTTPGNPTGGHSGASWSHDGQLIAFSVAAPMTAAFELWVKPTGGGEARKLATEPGDLLGFGVRVGVQPQFAPDDRAIYWIGRTRDGSDTLSRLRLDQTGAPIGQEEVLIPFVGSFVEGISIAREGTVAVALTRVASNIWTVPVGGGAPKSEPFALTQDEARDTVPSFAPDGRLAFSQQVIGQPTTVWLMNAGDRKPELLTVGLAASVWFPQWEPDSQRIFVLQNDRSRAATIDTTTRAMTDLSADVRGAVFPKLSPDGRTLAFHIDGAGGVGNVWTTPVDGGPRRQVTFDKESAGFVQWSPDGRSLALELQRGDDDHIGVVSIDGGTIEQITFEPGESWPGGWATDNDRIVFAGERDGVWNVFTVSRRTRAVTQWTHFTSTLGFVRYPVWSPQNDRIVFERNERKSNLWTTKLP